MAELVDAHVSGACAARRAGSIPVLGTIPIEDSAGGVIHFTPPVFCLCSFGVAIIWAHLTNQGEPSQCFCPFRVGRAKVGRNVRQIVQGKPFLCLLAEIFLGDRRNIFVKKV